MSLVIHGLSPPSEVIDLSGLYLESASTCLRIVIIPAHRRNRDSIVHIDLLVFFTNTGIDSFSLEACRWTFRHYSCIELLCMLDKPLHLFVVNVFLHFLKIFTVLRGSLLYIGTRLGA